MSQYISRYHNCDVYNVLGLLNAFKVLYLSQWGAREGPRAN